MSKNNATNKEKTVKKTLKKTDASAIEEKTQFVNGLGASAEFTSVD